MLLRALVNGEHATWLDRWCCSSRRSTTPTATSASASASGRCRTGRSAGVGTRPNAQDLDLNRDHMKLESPEARSLVRLLRDYDPHVGIDLHTTNGTYHAYHLTYSPPLHPNTRPAIVGAAARRLAAGNHAARSRRKDGWDFYYYGNVPDAAPTTPCAAGTRSTIARASTTTTSACATASRS